LGIVRSGLQAEDSGRIVGVRNAAAGNRVDLASEGTGVRRGRRAAPDLDPGPRLGPAPGLRVAEASTAAIAIRQADGRASAGVKGAAVRDPARDLETARVVAAGREAAGQEAVDMAALPGVPGRN